jgi:hypothetical protein
VALLSLTYSAANLACCGLKPFDADLLTCDTGSSRIVDAPLGFAAEPSGAPLLRSTNGGAEVTGLRPWATLSTQEAAKVLNASWTRRHTLNQQNRR